MLNNNNMTKVINRALYAKMYNYKIRKAIAHIYVSIAKTKLHTIYLHKLKQH